MASKNEKICHLLLFILMLVYFRIASTTNIDCGGKPFHCVNSTHFMICVDVGAGISKTVDDFTIQCPSTTVCRGTNYFECEYQAPITTEGTIPQEEENFKFETIPHTTTRLSEYVNTISVTTQSDIITDTNKLPPSTTSNLILTTTTQPYVAENIITTFSKTNPVNTSEPLESLKISKDKFQKGSTISFYSKSEQSIEANTTRNNTNERNITNSIPINDKEAFNKNETPYMKSADTLLHSETTKETSTNHLSTSNSQDVPRSYINSNPTISTLPDLITWVTDYVNKRNITFKKTTSEDIQDLSSNGTTKLLPLDLTNMNKILSENVNLKLKENYNSSIIENQTLTTGVNLFEQTADKELSSNYATESSIMFMQNNHITKDTTTKDVVNVNTTHVNTINPLFKTSFSRTTENTIVTPVTTVSSFSALKLTIKSLEATTFGKETESTTASNSIMKGNNLNLFQDEVNTNTPLGVTLTIPYSITTQNTTIASLEAPSTTMKVTTTHLLQDQITTETTSPEELSSIFKEMPLLINNSLTQKPESTTFSSQIDSEITKELITENVTELVRSFKVTKANSDTSNYISTITETTVFNKSTQGFPSTTFEYTTEKIATASNKSEFNNTKLRHVEKNNSSDVSIKMLYLIDQPTMNWLEDKKISSTENPIITKIGTLSSESYPNTENPPVGYITSVEITKKRTTEMPPLSSNTDINDSLSPKYQTTLKKSLLTEVYELLTDKDNTSKVDPTPITKMSKMGQISENKVTKEATTENSLAFNDKTNDYSKLQSQEQTVEENSFAESTSSSTTIILNEYRTNENNTADSFVFANTEPAPTVGSSGIPIKTVYMDNINTSTNTMKIDELFPIQDLYSSSTEISNKPVSDDNSLVNVTNIFINFSDILTTSSSINKKETFLSQNLTSVTTDNNSEKFTTEKIITELDIMNKTITGNNSMPLLNDTVQGLYTKTKNVLLPQQQTINIEMVNTEILNDKDKNGIAIYMTERLKGEQKTTDLYNVNYKSDMMEITTTPQSNAEFGMFPTVQTSDSVLLSKIDKVNGKVTEFVAAENEGLKLKQLTNDKHISQTVLETTGVTLNSSNIHEHESNLGYISNRTVNTQVESLKPISVDKIKLTVSNNNTLGQLVTPENAEKIFQNNNSIINKESMVMSTVSTKVTENTVVDSVFSPVSDIYTTIIPRIATENAGNILQGTYYKDSMNTQPAHSVSSSSDATDKFEVSANKSKSSKNSQIVTASTEAIFKNQNNFVKELISDVISDAMSTQPAQKNMARSVLSLSATTTTDTVRVSANHKITAITPKFVTASTVPTFPYNNNFEKNADISDTVNTQIIKETIDQPILASTDETKVLASTIITTINPLNATKSTGKVFESSNIKHKVNTIIAETVITQPAQTTIVSHPFLNSSTPASIDKIGDLSNNKFTGSNPQTAVGKTLNVFHIQNKADMVINNNISNIQLDNETVGYFGIGSSTLASTDETKLSTRNKFTTIHSQAVPGSTENIFVNNNANNILINKEDLVTTDIVNNQLTKDTDHQSILGLFTPALTNGMKVSPSNKKPNITEKIFKSNKNYGNETDVVISKTMNTQPTQKIVAPSILDTLTSAPRDVIKVLNSNIITTINPQVTTESSTGKLLNKNNNVKDEVDRIISDVVDAQVVKESVIQSTLGSSTQASIYQLTVSPSAKITTINPQMLVKRTGNIFKYNNSNFESKVDVVNSDLLKTQPAQKTVAHYVLSSSTLASTDKLNFSDSAKISTINSQTVNGSKEKIFGKNNNSINLENNANAVINYTVSTQLTHSTIGSLTPAIADDIKVPDSNITTTINPLITTEGTGQLFHISNNNNYENKVDASDMANNPFVKNTRAHSVSGSSTKTSTDEIKILVTDTFSPSIPETVTGRVGNIFQYNNNKFKNKVVITSDAMNTQTTKSTEHSVLNSSYPTSTHEIKVLDNYMLTTKEPQLATRSIHKMLENNNNFVNERKDTLVHILAGFNSTTVSFGRANNNEFNVLQNESIPTVFSTNQIPKLNSENLGIQDHVDTVPKVPVSTLPTVLQERKTTDNPLSLKISKIRNKPDSDININNMQNITHKDDNFFAVVPSKPIHITNKKHEPILKHTTVPEIYEAGKVLQNKSQHITTVTKDYKRIANKDLFKCQNRFRGRYADEDDCRKFYICIGRMQPLLGECPVNTVFSEIKKQCTKNLSHCIRHNQFHCTQSGRFADAFKNNVYYICVQNKNTYVQFQFQCQGGYHLNKYDVKCVRDQQMSSSIDIDSNKASGQSAVESKSKEKERTKKAKKNMCTKEGKFPDAHDCRKYYVCSEKSKSVFKRKTKKCDSDEVFHPEKEKCVDNDSYECG